MKANNKESILRTVRLTPEIDEILQKDALEKRVSVNSLIISIMRKYAEWDRYTDRFGYISVSKDLFNSILQATDDTKLNREALQLGLRQPKESILFFFHELNLDTFLEYVKLSCKYGHIAEYEIGKQDSEYIVRIHHDLGYKWSSFLETCIGQTIRNQLKINPTFESIQNSLISRFTPQKNNH